MHVASLFKTLPSGKYKLVKTKTINYKFKNIEIHIIVQQYIAKPTYDQDKTRINVLSFRQHRIYTCNF